MLFLLFSPWKVLMVLLSVATDEELAVMVEKPAEVMIEADGSLSLRRMGSDGATEFRLKPDEMQLLMAILYNPRPKRKIRSVIPQINTAVLD